MIVCRVKSEMEWLVITEREKKLVSYKFLFPFWYLLVMLQLIFFFLLQLIFNCFPLFFVMGMFANEFETKEKQKVTEIN